MTVIEVVASWTTETPMRIQDEQKRELIVAKPNDILGWFALDPIGHKASKCKVLFMSASEDIVTITLNKVVL